MKIKIIWRKRIFQHVSANRQSASLLVAVPWVTDNLTVTARNVMWHELATTEKGESTKSQTR
jgi:hypothetical protein